MRSICSWLSIGLLLVSVTSAMAYSVGPPVNLDKLEAEADVIFKATAVSSKGVTDKAFDKLSAFECFETTFKLISAFKGEITEKEVLFRHYSLAPRGAWMYEPQHYRFQPGQTYLVFAKRSATEGRLQQIWMSHKGKEDQGVLRCSNDQPLSGATIKEVMLTEITALLNDQSTDNVGYGIDQLNSMSGSAGSAQHDFRRTTDFDREETLKLLLPLLSNKAEKVAKAASALVGSDNPYMNDQEAEFWLATVGSGVVPGLAKRDRNMRNSGGELYWRELSKIANVEGPPATRAGAVRSLGLVHRPELLPFIEQWLKDATPEVRASATLLLADFPGTAQAHLRELASDSAPEVRLCVAHAIGFLQATDLAKAVEGLLVDSNKKVRAAAARSLLSFSPHQPGISDIFKRQLDKPEFHPLFLNALARENPSEWLEPLMKVIKEHPSPQNWSGGEIPAYTAWGISWNYLLDQSDEALRAGKLDTLLDAMENCYNSGSGSGSNEPTSLYAFYVKHRMTDRAARYRQTVKQSVTYDIETYFKRAEAQPDAYLSKRGQ